MPTVSVVICTYNRADVVSTAIESALGQTYDDFEVVVVDDGSTDDTRSVVETYDDVRYIRHERNRGANSARNTGIRAARGTYISFLDSDDEFTDRNLECTVAYLDRLPDNYGGVFTSFLVFGDGNEVHRAPYGPLSYRQILRRNVVGSLSCTMFRRDVFDEVGYLDETFPSRQDIEFYVRVLEEYDMFGIPLTLVKKHERDDSITSNLRRRAGGYRRFFEKHGEKLPPDGIAYTHYLWGLDYVDAGRIAEANDHFRKAVRHDPTNPYYLYFFVCSSFGPTVFRTGIALGSRLKSLAEPL